MPVAAVPAYLGSDFKQASPGMRFGMYLPLWGLNNRTGDVDWSTKDTNYRVTGRDRREREFRDDNKRGALEHACGLSPADRGCMAALLQRQRVVAATQGSRGALFVLEAQSISPFTTGIGNEHPLENGFAFLWPYGLPYLPGSGVKGVVRQAACELARGLWGDELRSGWDEKRSHLIRVGTTDVLLSMLDVLFGKETERGEKEHFRGVLTFWDVIPQIEGGALRVEIMTPHQKHYYQDGKPPHDCGDPNPIPFLTVPPGSRFVFHVVCDEARLARVASDLVERTDGGVPRWRVLLKAAFGHAFQWLGFGAKTAVGYGVMARRDERAQRPDEQPGAPRITVEESEERWADATVRFEPGPQLLTATGPGGRTAIARGKAAVDALLEGFSKSRLNRLKGGLRMAVRVRRKGNQLEIVSLEP